MAAGNLSVDMRWYKLLPESMSVVKEFKKIDLNFYQPGNMIVAISGPDPVILEQMTDDATEILRQDLVCDLSLSIEECISQERYARYVYGKFPEKWLVEHSMRLTKPNDTRRMADLFSDPRLLPFLTHLNDDFEAEYSESENVKNQERQIVSSLDAVQEFVHAVSEAANGKIINEARMARVVRDLTIGNPYMLSLDKQMSLIMVSSGVPSTDAEHGPLIDKRIEELLKPLAARHPGYKIERTGVTAVTRDEMDAVGPATLSITLGAMLVIFVLLVWNFRSVLIPILTLIPIVIGIIWSVGFIVLTLGTMNIFTMMIMVVLLGLGIDFSIHLASRFHEEQVAGKTIDKALYATLAKTGKGVVTGAFTTSAAFFTLMIADTKGISEFGFCAGSGVLISLGAVLWILPTLLALCATRTHSASAISSSTHNFTALGSWAVTMGQWRIVVIPLFVFATTAGIWAGTKLSWEWNINKLEPKGLRSVQLQNEIINKYKLSISMSVLTTETIEESRRLRKEFKEKSLIGEVDDISLWISRPDFEHSRPHINRLHEALTEPYAPLTFMNAEEHQLCFADELDRLWANLVEIQALSFLGGQDRVVEKTTQLVATRETRETGFLRKVADRFLDTQQIDWQTLEGFAEHFHQQLAAQAVKMSRADKPVAEQMVPEHILARYTSISGIDGYVMQIMPKKNLFEKEELVMFQDLVSKIHPNVTGIPQMLLHMNLATIQEGKMAVMAAMTVIIILLLLDFRQPAIAGLALLPLISGIALMLGILWLFGEKLNYINTIAFPVVIGIGVDNGVHFFHRVRQEGRDRIEKAVTSVGRAILMSSLTTMIGFGSLMFYLMEGVKSMGFAMFVGVGMCFFVTVTFLPALTVLFENRILKKENTSSFHAQESSM